MNRPSWLLGSLLFCVLFLLSGCQQKVFVGFPTPTPTSALAASITVVNAEDAPMPPVGPRTVNPFLALRRSGVGRSSAPLETGGGPPFDWRETDNYLILGTDRRDGWTNWRTDTIMVVGLDRRLQRAAVLSIPRDLYIEIPGYGWGRINQVDYIGEKVLKVDGGGPALVSTVLSNTLGIQTGHWIRFEMNGFVSVVDAVGGVTIHLDCPFYEPIFNLTTNSWDYFTLPAGEVHMDGDTAYWFVRLRLRESDIGRARRQRQFLWALRDQVLQTNLLPRVPELWLAFRDSFTTDLTLLEVLDLLRFGISLDPANVRAAGITLKELQSYTTENGASVLIIADPEKVRAVVENIWDAPAMVDSNRQDSERCEPIPTGPPNVTVEAVPTPGSTPVPDTAPIDVPGGENGEENNETIGAEGQLDTGGG
ncbi:LCP family protein [Litorilinea aerophila]|uniref:LCP family protein n=1 Tax=Litorilinea aerophila TaxID=1204385 RepID=UPI00147784D8|nr:LCP family protein [Litorilinea aerophila]MCC9078229.1 LCP family protein [Litorilinea aerophila]